MDRRKLYRWPAFTLVELLVVIGIITLLIGILIPTLAKSREYARSVVCSSNLRQIGMGLQLYVSENNGTLPWAELSYTASAGTSVVQTWDDQIARYLGSTTAADQLEAVATPVRNKVFECPADDLPRSLSPTYGTGPIFPRSYAYVRAFGYDPVHNLRFRGAGGQAAATWPIDWRALAPSLCRKLSWYDDPTTKFLVTERPLGDNVLGGYGGYVDNSVDNWASLDAFLATAGHTLHGDVWHSLCADGHVEGNTINDCTLLPALNKARPIAQQIMVSSNLRQIGIALQVYQNSYQGYIPGITNNTYETAPSTGAAKYQYPTQ